MTNQIIKKMSGIRKMCDQLNDAQISQEGLNQIMETLGRCADSNGLTFIRKSYLKESDYQFEFVAGWLAQYEAIDFEKKIILATDVEPDSLDSLDEHQLVIGKQGAEQLFAANNYILVPLFCETSLYGVLCFTDFETEADLEIGIEFALTVGQAFELWLSKSQAERRFAELIEFIPNPIMILDTEGVVTTWNKALQQMSGTPAENVVGKGNYEHSLSFYNERRPTPSNLIFNPDPHIESQYLEFQRQGDTLTALAQCDNLPEGGAFVASKTGVLHDATGKPSKSIHLIQDVTREREMVKNLRRSEAMYRTMIDFAGVGIVLFREDNILHHNEYFATLLGIKDRNITYQDFIQWIDPQEKEIVSFFKNPHEMLKEETHFEFRAIDDDGHNRYYRGHAKSIGYEDKAAIHFILDDITEQKKLTEKAHLNELRMYHEDRLSALGVMAAGIAHEINQPLNTIRVITDGILYGRDQGWELDEKEFFEGLEMVSRQVLRMSRVIQTIRDFAREDRGKCEMINPNDAITNVLSMIGKQFEAHGINIDIDLQSDLPLIKSNVNNLEQVIMNLVVNARQALEDSRKKKRRLWIKTGFNHGQIFIEVGDNAAGIPEDLMLKVFDPFFTTKAVGKGTGLGLSISQTIVSDFNGTLKAYNNDQQGATFFITTPAAGEINENSID